METKFGGFLENENILEISEGRRDGGVYRAVDGGGCKGCSFVTLDKDCEFDRATLGSPRCDQRYRKDKRSIIWVKQRENKMTQKPEPQKHRHYDLIMQWASEPTQQVWAWQGIHGWEKVLNLTWNMKHYAIGEKPTTPPTLKATVKISLDTTELTIELPIGSRKEEVEKAILDKAVQFINHDYEFGK